MDRGIQEVLLLMKNTLPAHSSIVLIFTDFLQIAVEKGHDEKSFLSMNIISELEEQIGHQRTFHDLRSSFQSLQ